jgi:23S rRNA U2552 (ribose-2'-O)-methylase RlmE/FtsJ
MDSPGIPGPVLEVFHRDLVFIHKCLGTFPTIERLIRSDPLPVRRVIDIGCGGGALLDYLRRKLNVEVIGVDRAPVPAPPGVTIIAADALSGPLPEADVAVTTLTAHHLTSEENIALIRNVGRSCRRFIIHDLIRHPLPLALFTIFLCRLIGKEAAVDGRQSIRRAYTPDEFRQMAGDALAGSGTFSIDVSPFRSRQIVDIRY